LSAPKYKRSARKFPQAKSRRNKWRPSRKSDGKPQPVKVTYADGHSETVSEHGFSQRRRYVPAPTKRGLSRKELRRIFDHEGYAGYLKTDHWQALKKAYRESDLPQACVECGDPHYELHHLSYKTLGREALSDLEPRCRQHHEEAHKAA
jgi:hypothetical protein